MSARLCAFAFLVAVAGCDSAASEEAKPEPSTPTVEVVPVIAQRLETTTRLQAEIFPYEGVALYPRVNGFVEEMLVDRGDIVHKGQLLVRLSAPELAAQRAEAASKRAAARSTYDRTRAAAETPGVIAKHDLEIAEAALRAEEARVRSLRTLEGYLHVYAPFDGIITERNVHPGALVGPPAGGTPPPMLRMESIAHLRVTVAVPETDAGAIAAGAMAGFVVRTWPGTTFSGVIKRIAHSVDVHTRTMAVELDYVNRDGKIAPGMFAEVLWPIRREHPTLFVPPSAIVQTPDKIFVQRIKGGAVEQVAVKRGIALPDRIEVFSDRLAPGDIVVKRGSEELKPGTKVQLEAADGGSLPVP